MYKIEVTEKCLGVCAETNEGDFYFPGEHAASVQRFLPCVRLFCARPVKGVFVRVSAPGYLDCGDWHFGETLVSALESLFPEIEGEPALEAQFDAMMRHEKKEGIK